MTHSLVSTKLPTLPRGVVFWLGFMLASLVFASLLIAPQWGQLTLATKPDALLSVRALPLMAGVYLLAACFLALSPLKRAAWLGKTGVAALFTASAMALGLIITASWESFQVLEEGHIAMTNLYEASVLMLAVTGALGVWLERRWQKPSLTFFLAPLLVAGVVFVLWLGDLGQAGPRHLVPALKSYWLPFHVMANFIGYGCFAVAAAAGMMQLVALKMEKMGAHIGFLPTSHQAENLAYRAISIGFPVFTLAIVLGSAWAYEAWGGYWSWDPKETWALIVWLVYGGYLHARLTHGWKGAKLAWWAIIGFVLTLFCYLGVNMFLSGLHSYGQIT